MSWCKNSVLARRKTARNEQSHPKWHLEDILKVHVWLKCSHFEESIKEVVQCCSATLMGLLLRVRTYTSLYPFTIPSGRRDFQVCLTRTSFPDCHQNYYNHNHPRPLVPFQIFELVLMNWIFPKQKEKNQVSMTRVEFTALVIAVSMLSFSFNSGTFSKPSVRVMRDFYTPGVAVRETEGDIHPK